MSVFLHHPPLQPPFVDKMALEPPTYTPSAAVPAYSVVPAPSERILAATARLRRRAPAGVFVRRNGPITVALREQEPDAHMPSYGRHGTIYGDIGLNCTQGVQAVYIRVRARPSRFHPPVSPNHPVSRSPEPDSFTDIRHSFYCSWRAD